MGYGKILVAYDGSEHSDQAFEAAVDFVNHELAASILVFAATSLFDKTSFTSQVGDMATVLKTLEGLDEKEAALAEYVSKFPGYPEGKVGVKAEFGNPRDEILRVAKEESCGLIIVGSRGLGAVRGALGSVSYGVIVHAGAPVLIVK